SGPGQFNTPSGVAVSDTRLVVADKGNARLQIFDPSGAFLFAVSAPASLGSMHPFGVALDPQGRMVAVDEPGDRVLAFDAAGNFLFAAGRDGNALGRMNDPRGIAASPLGMLYVADHDNKNVQKLDAFQNFVLRFNGSGSLPQPVGAALDSAGRLFVTDIQRDQILEFGLTAGGSSGLQFLSDPNGLMGSGQDERLSNGALAGGAADPSFVFHDAFVFPNPSKGGAVPTLHAEVGIADRVTFKIYSIAGQ